MTETDTRPPRCEWCGDPATQRVEVKPGTRRTLPRYARACLWHAVSVERHGARLLPL